ncbi:Phosphoinositide phosphatase sac1 [Massospora cicadina]|nr:Phosphoinositide phosphatase sac1 [Massospora cicadina]
MSDISAEARGLPRFLTEPQISTAYGMLGIMRLLSGDHLMLITGRVCVGDLAGHAIYKATATRICPLARNAFYLTPDQASDEERYRGLLGDFLQGAAFYFSPTLDMTRNLQQLHPLCGPRGSGSLIDGANPEFFWNLCHLKPFLEITKAHPDQNFAKFLVPVIYGYARVVPVTINKVPLAYGLITRRGTSRVGTRYFSRGIDAGGNVANFAETEQVLVSRTGAMASYSQVRGSIPVFWAQVTNTQYTPQLVIADRPETPRVFKAHFERLAGAYGPVVAVNLVNTEGYELPMAQKFAFHAQSQEGLTYIHFDFHRECSKMRWHRIQRLVDQLLPHLDAHMYYLADPTRGEPIFQQGVIRTNCMDCLDRTNVVQSMVAKHILTCQLKAMGVISEDYLEGVFVEPFASVFRELWADNADAVSVAYSGTGALKTDFTRTGRRTALGALRDGKNSMVRYLRNNYLDGSRQDGIDLFLNRYTPSPDLQSPFQSCLPWRVQVALGLLLSGFTLALAHLVGWISISYLGLVIGFGLMLASLHTLSVNRAELVSRPRLVPFEYGFKRKASSAGELLAEKPGSSDVLVAELPTLTKPKGE